MLYVLQMINVLYNMFRNYYKSHFLGWVVRVHCLFSVITHIFTENNISWYMVIFPLWIYVDMLQD